MAEPLTLLTMLTGIGTLFSKTKKAAETAQDVLNSGQKVYETLTTTSVSRSASRTIISPLVGVEDTLLHAEYMSDLMTVVNLRDIRDVLTHLQLKGRVNNIEIANIIDSINPRRSGFLALQGAEAFGSVAGMESQPKKTADNKVVINGKVYSDLNEYVPLAVGRTVDASVTIDGHTLPVTLTFRQTPVPISSNDLLTIFSAAAPKDGWYARIMGWKSGELTSPEVLGGVDEIIKEFNIRNNDMSGYYEEVKSRDANNKMAALRSGVMSMNTEANTIIMSSDTARNIELELGVSFDSRGIGKIRQAVMANTIIICNESTGIFTFYYSGNNRPEVYTRREITVASKKDTSMDLSSLMKLFSGR